MRKIILPLFAASVLAIAGCKKDEACPAVTLTAPAEEVTALKQYLTDRGISAKEDSRGFFYVIATEGGTKKPDACSNVTVNYKGTLINGTVFDESSAPVGFSLTSVIAGWREGIPLVGEGGKITLYVPPSLAYGSNPPSRAIPPNATLIFDVELLKVN